MILEKEREEVTSEAEQLADSVSNEAAPVETAPRKMVKCPSKTGINMNQREKSLSSAPRITSSRFLSSSVV